VGDTGASLHPIQLNGDWGHSTNRDRSLGKGSSFGVLLDIDDEFMYNLPEGQSVLLTIEYWDGVHPQFPGDYNPETDKTFARIRAHYDSNGTGDKISVDGTGITHLTDDFHIRNRDKWNKVSFVIDDFKAGNGIMSNWDLEITDWGGSVNVARDVIYKSVRLEYYDKKSDAPLSLTDSINLGVPGNFEDIEKESFTLNIPMKNIAEDNISVFWKFEIRDENNIVIDEFNHSCSLSSLEERTDSVDFKNPGLCGVYTVKAYADVKYSNGDRISKYYGDENFSVAYISPVGNGNDTLGINVHALGGGYGDFKTITDVLSRAGFGWIREANGQNLTKASDGNWVVSDRMLEDLQYIEDKGINVLMQLWGPTWKWEHGTEGGCIPLTDGDRQMFGEWCEDLAAQVDGYVDAYEVFNEPGTTMFPDDFEGNKGEEYVKALKLAYEAIKAVNKDTPVVGPVSATQLGVSYEFTEQVYEAGGMDYLDIHSTHRYPYTGTLYIKELLTSVGREQEEKLIKEYAGGVNPFDGMWLTEYGHNTENKLTDGEGTGEVADPWDNPYWNSNFGLGYYDSVPRRTQARGLALGYAVTQGMENSFDKLFVHNAIDFWDITNSEHAWGVMNSYTGDEGYTPHSAKPSLVATAAFNHFIDDTSTVKSIIDEDLSGRNEWNRLFAIWFDNSANTKFDKDVIYLQTEIGESSDITLSLGCKSVDVYDIYGNKLGTMESAYGQYKLKASIEPYYLVGDFTSLSKGISFTNISVDSSIIKNCVAGENKTFTVSGMSSGDTFEAVGFETVSVASDSVTVKVPDIYEGRAYGHIKVLNSGGKLRAVLPVEFWIPDSELYITADEAELNIRGLAGLGGDDVTVLVTDKNNMPIGISQKRASEGGVIDFSLEIPDADNELMNLKVYNGSLTIQQQIIPDFEMSYTYLLNGEFTSLSSIDISDLSEGDELQIKLNLTNNSGNANPELIFTCACYDEDGRLVNVETDTTDWADGNSDVLGITVPSEAVSDISNIKLYVWDSVYNPVKKDININ